MSLIWRGRPFGVVDEPIGYYEPPDPLHCPCPRHSNCEAPLPHCGEVGKGCSFDQDDFERDETAPICCACDCIDCRRNRRGVPRCDDDTEHRKCEVER